MLTLGLSAQSLLAKTDALGLFVNHIFLYGVTAPIGHTVLAEVILTILCEEMLTGNFLNCCVEVGSIIQFFDAPLVVRGSERQLQI
jgi:hypothetical protein